MMNDEMGNCWVFFCLFVCLGFGYSSGEGN